MHKKDFELIAGVFQAHSKRYGGRTDAVIVEVIEDMCLEIGVEYAKFDREKFLVACEIKKSEF